MSEKTPSVSERRRAAGIGEQLSMSEVAKLGTVTWISKEESHAILPETGEVTEGFYCKIQDSAGTAYGVFVGQQVLRKELAELKLPFTASVRRKGRTYLFFD